MRVRWFSQALGDLVALREYIARDKFVAASVVAERIRLRVKQLADQPEMGRSGRVEGTRELVIVDTPYLVAYRIKADEIQVLRVFHHAQQWPKII